MHETQIDRKSFLDLSERYMYILYTYIHTCYSPAELDVFVDDDGKQQSSEGVVPADDEHDGETE